MNWSRNLFLWLVVNESLDLKRKNNEINLFSTIHVLKDKKRLTFVNSCVPFFPLSVALMKSVSIKVSVSDTKLKIIWMTSLCAKGRCVTASQRWCRLVDIFLKFFSDTEKEFYPMTPTSYKVFYGMLMKTENQMLNHIKCANWNEQDHWKTVLLAQKPKNQSKKSQNQKSQCSPPDWRVIHSSCLPSSKVALHNTPWHSRESDHMEFCGKKLSNGPAPLHYVTHTLFWFVMQHL